MSEKYKNSQDKRPFFIILLIGLFLTLLLVFTFFAYQMGRRTAEQPNDVEDNRQNPIATAITEISPFDNSAEAEEYVENLTGSVRINPFPAGSIIDQYGWEVELLEFERGDTAWQTLHTNHPSNPVPPEGKEYLNVKLRIKNNTLEEDFFSFGLTGNSLRKYYGFDNYLISPDPWLEQTIPGRTAVEGWDSFVIKEDEDNLMLVFDIGDYDDPPVYLALEAGSAIPFDPAMVNIARTDLGASIDQPVPFGQAATGEDWQLVVLDVVKGDEAWAQILDTNQFNDPPEDGMAYIMVKLRARYIGTNDEGEDISYSPFSLMTTAGDEFGHPSVVQPEPELDYILYPGGEAEGWIVLTMPEEIKNLTLFFSPDSSGANDRYLSLGQGR